MRAGEDHRAGAALHQRRAALVAQVDADRAALDVEAAGIERVAACAGDRAALQGDGPHVPPVVLSKSSWPPLTVTAPVVGMALAVPIAACRC